MTELLTPDIYPEHFELKHENGKALLCLTEDEECSLLAEISAEYTPAEEQVLTNAIRETLIAVNRLVDNKAGSVFAGLRIMIGEGVTEGGAEALPADNTILLNGRKMLVSIADMRILSDAYDDDELVDFPNGNKPGSALRYTLAHEMGHIIDYQTKRGNPYSRIASEYSPTRYGRIPDSWHEDKKHEAFADAFAHLAWDMDLNEAAQTIASDTVQARVEEASSSK